MAAGILDRLISKISPKGENYFIWFNELSALTVQGATSLAKMSTSSDPSEFKRLFEEINKAEGDADKVTAKILVSLHKAFITPFDRSEIKDLAMSLDDIVDYMEDIPQRASLYGPGTFTPEMAALGQVALRATEKVAHAVSLLNDMKNAPQILKICAQVGEIESESDRIMRGGMARLFAEVTDARALIRGKELYELFEEVVDRCEDAADVIHGVVLERI